MDMIFKLHFISLHRETMFNDIGHDCCHTCHIKWRNDEMKWMYERSHQKRHKTQVYWSQPVGSNLVIFIFPQQEVVLIRMETLHRNPRVGLYFLYFREVPTTAAWMSVHKGGVYLRISLECTGILSSVGHWVWYYTALPLCYFCTK